MGNKIRVLVVDDSAVVRQSLSSILEKDPEIEVMGTAADPIIAVKKIMKEVPDVITLGRFDVPKKDYGAASDTCCCHFIAYHRRY